jgi:predicted cupin superfamily sugar epimerase
VATAIYFLLSGSQFSALHRIKSDEIWHFYAGSSLAVEAIHPDGTRQTWRVGVDLAAGDLPQAVVPAGAWFGAEMIDKRAYALVGCTVSPGFDFADFELAERSALLARFPQHAGVILRLTR